MAKNNSDLFTPLVRENKRHPVFEKIRKHPKSFAARRMVAEIWNKFEDRDDNFTSDFQTAGFNARLFELYLFEYFTRSGYAIDFTHSRPDFMVERNGVRVAIEATTSNCPEPFVVEELLDSSTEEIARKQCDEIPVCLGRPLLSKLNSKCWELPHVAGLPLVIAIEAFRDTAALSHPGGVFAKYIYGLNDLTIYSEGGRLLIKSASVATHHRVEKSPTLSNFFAQPSTEHVSAILLTNNDMYSKFERMGFLTGHHRGDVMILHAGTWWDPDVNTSRPKPFGYEIRQRPTLELWGEGLEVYHNPNALIPLPRGFFAQASDSILTEAKTIASLIPDFHPFMSYSISLHDNTIPEVVKVGGVRVELISAREFNDLRRSTKKEAERLEPFAAEVEFWADERRDYIASVLLDFDWNAVILKRDSEGIFRPIHVVCDLPDRERARVVATEHIAARRRAAMLGLT